MSTFTFFFVVLPALLTLVALAIQIYLWWTKKSPLRRFLELFLSLEKFRKRARQDFQEKLRIGRYVKDYLSARADRADKNLAIFLESGTTAAEIGLALVTETRLQTYTNNLLVGLAYAGKDAADFCHLLPGVIDDEYPGIVGEATVDRLKEVLKSHCGLAIMNATSFDIVGGPCVHSETNRSIKRCILTHSLEVLICFSSSKLLYRDAEDAAPSIYSAHEWEERLKTKDLHLVIGVPSKLRPIKRARFDQRLGGLREYLRLKGIPHEVEKSTRHIWHIHSPAAQTS